MSGVWNVTTSARAAISSRVDVYKRQGIDAVVADTDASVEYFTLQGVRVAIPEAGIYLCRKGDKVTKVIIR